jgi:hypothetical protein
MIATTKPSHRSVTRRRDRHAGGAPHGRRAGRVGAGVSAQDESAAPGLVTEGVESGIERIVRDDAGHDLDAKHPTYRDDMDDVFVTPVGTVWVNSSYRDTDNDVNPPGSLVWALGQSGTPQYTPPARFCFPSERGIGVDYLTRPAGRSRAGRISRASGSTPSH